MRKLAAFAFALGLTLAVNGVGVFLLLYVNSGTVAAQESQESRVVHFDVPPPPPKKPRRVKVDRPPRKVEAKAPPVPVPNLPSAIQADSLRAPDLDVAGLIAPVGEEDRRDGARLVMNEEAVDERPRLVRRVPPSYPVSAADAGVEGEVVLRLLVNREGQVERVQVERSQPSGVFDAAARHAAVKWRFTPAMFEGQRVSVWCRNRLVFRLASEEG